MSAYAWIVTADHIFDPEFDTRPVVGVMGPSTAPEALIEGPQAGAGEPFSMYDDDGEHYYDGRIIGDFEGLEPLDDFGAPYAGATEIRINGIQI